jgi:DNA replication protein DnaC
MDSSAETKLRDPVVTAFNVGAPELYENAKLSDLLPRFPKVFEELNKMLDVGHGVMLISGTNGAGKTHAACAALNEALKRRWYLNGSFVNYESFMTKWKESINLGIPFHEKSYITERDFLIFDDIGVTQPSAAALELLYDITEQRYGRHKKSITVYTTNLNSDECFKVLGRAVLSRISAGPCLRMDGPDNRKAF